MRKILITLSAVLGTLLFVVMVRHYWLSRSQFKNYQTPGNLESLNKLGCLESSDLRNNYTPADLYKGTVSCIKDDKYDHAVLMFAMAATYGRFDSLRVKDHTARQALTVMVMEDFAELKMQKKQKFMQEKKKELADAQDMKEICSAISQIGPPNYYPRYMIQHGIEAVGGKDSGEGLVPQFDPKQGWEESLVYLGCSKK